MFPVLPLLSSQLDLPLAERNIDVANAVLDARARVALAQDLDADLGVHA